MNLTRRGLLLGAGAVLVLPARVRAQSGLEREHQPRIEMPVIAEDATAVPVQVSVEHPMEPDHYIRSIELTVDQDPVAHKGKFSFSPGNGRAWVAFTMRSGSGGVARAVAECTKHGRFTATREYRVADNGCASTAPEASLRAALGHPQLRLPRTVKAGEVVEVRTKLDHNSYTGLVSRGGKLVREVPEFYVKDLQVFLDDQRICDFQLTSAVSANPVIRFAFKPARSGTLRVVFVNSEGQRWEASQPVKV